jgi:hypothetical protein
VLADGPEPALARGEAVAVDPTEAATMREVAARRRIGRFGMTWNARLTIALGPLCSGPGRTRPSPRSVSGPCLTPLTAPPSMAQA